jgi:hypothetical protein
VQRRDVPVPSNLFVFEVDRALRIVRVLGLEGMVDNTTWRASVIMGVYVCVCVYGGGMGEGGLSQGGCFIGKAAPITADRIRG